MKFELWPKRQQKPEQNPEEQAKLEKSRENYDKEAAERAAKYSESSGEEVTKEDVIYIDAGKEKSERWKKEYDKRREEEMEKNRENYGQEAAERGRKRGVTKEEVIHSDAILENDLKDEKKWAYNHNTSFAARKKFEAFEEDPDIAQNLYTKSESKSSQEELEKSRKKYEKDAAETARKQNTLMENATGRGIKKEGVVHADAILEDEIRQEIATWGRLGGEEGLLEPETRSYKEAKKRLENLNKDANFTVKIYVKKLERKSKSEKPVARMEGTLGGKKVEIEFEPDSSSEPARKNLAPGYDDITTYYAGRWSEERNWREHTKIYSAKIDGKPISDNLAKEIMVAHADNAIRRQNIIDPEKSSKRRKTASQSEFHGPYEGPWIDKK